MKSSKRSYNGKIMLSQYFKKLEDGQKVAIVEENSIPSNFPTRFLGRSGLISGTRGEYKLVDLKIGSKIKTFIIHPIHLRKLK